MSDVPVLVCLFCHADDEFAVFAELDAQVAAGGRTLCVYLTDSAYGGQSAERRQQETRAVLRRIGVPDDSVHFPGCDLGIRDTKLHFHIAEAVAATTRVVPMDGPIRILVPAWEGGHHDHDAAHIVGLLVAREAPRTAVVEQFSVYNGRGLPGPAFRALSPIPENGVVQRRPVAWRARLRHLRYCLGYPSQWKTWLGLFPMVLAHYMVDGTQQLQRAEPARVLEPPHSGRLLYERRGFCTWKEFADATADARNTIANNRGVRIIRGVRL